jgi:hypothetical protein
MCNQLVDDDDNNNNNNNNNSKILNNNKPYLFYVMYEQLKGQLQTQHNKYNTENVN